MSGLNQLSERHKSFVSTMGTTLVSPVPYEELLVSYHQVFPFGKARGNSNH